MNININPRDLQKLMGGGGQAGVTGGSAGIPGILGLLNQQKNEPVMTAPFNPMLNTQDLMNPQRMHPYSTGEYSSGGPTSQYDTTSDNGMSQLMAQITKLLNEGPPNPQFQQISLPKFDPNAFEGQASGIVHKQFDPIISNLENQKVATEGRAKGNQKAVGDMYNQLAAYMGQQGVETGKAYDAAQKQSGQMYNDERDKIAGMYAADAAQQRAEAKRLGTEAFGTNDAIAQQNNDKNFQAGLMGDQKLAQNNAFEQQQLAAQDYDKAMQGAAKSEGGEAQQSIIRQLEDYMSQADTNIAGVQSQAAGSIQDLMMKLAEGTYNRDAANAQFGYQQQRDYIGDQNNLYDKNLDLMMKQLQLAQAASGDGSSGGSDKLNPWQSTAQFADQLDPGKGQDYIAAIQQAMSQRQELSGVNPTDANGQPIKMTPALFAQLIADSQASQGVDKNKEMMIAQQLYSLLYGK